MEREQLIAQSPLRILERSMDGSLGAGNLGVVIARAGVGKTACLVQIGLDHLLRRRHVLHLALGQQVSHVQSWYDELLEDLLRLVDPELRPAIREDVARYRLISAFGDRVLTVDRLNETLNMPREHLEFEADTILVDGYDWEGHPEADRSALLDALRTSAGELSAEAWLSAQTHREQTGDHPSQVPPPCDSNASQLDVAIFLEPQEGHVSLRLLKDKKHPEPRDTKLELHPDTLRLMAENDSATVREPSNVYTLLSGGAPGAEATFGECAGLWGLNEQNFTFEGHTPARQENLVLLDDDELSHGAVSNVYLERHMHRTYPDTPVFRRTLQSIWHQVNTAGEVFLVGELLPDDTVKGGTGWAAELARHLHKPVRVFDQKRRHWFRWNGEVWLEQDAPTISCRRFTGAGTRRLNDAGRAAIRELFQRSFGPQPSRA